MRHRGAAASACLGQSEDSSEKHSWFPTELQPQFEHRRLDNVWGWA
jgi:hypothetical protein